MNEVILLLTPGLRGMKNQLFHKSASRIPWKMLLLALLGLCLCHGFCGSNFWFIWSRCSSLSAVSFVLVPLICTACVIVPMRLGARHLQQRQWSGNK